MFRSLNEVRGYHAKTKDGTYGRVEDFYFDDFHWTVRYLVLETGNWLPGRLVLISPETFQAPDWEQKLFPLNISKEQIENSPPADTNQPVSRQFERELADHYQWQPYWGSPLAAAGSLGETIDPPMPELEDRRFSAGRRQQDPHLRSIKEVTGYGLSARDGDIGRVTDFIVNDADWSIHFMIVDTRAWLPGRHVIIAPREIKKIEWKDGVVAVDLSLEDVRRSPTYDPSESINLEATGAFDYRGKPLT